MKIIIIGAGWYGMHIINFLLENYKNIDIKILEKKKTFFDNSSNYNQNRLHLGYHYPRSSKTRELCKSGYDKFIKKYRDVIDFIDNNFYLISNESLIDYETYKKIYSNDIKFNHSEIVNRYFDNIDGNIINTKEKIVNSEKVKKYFKKNKKYIKFDYEVKNIETKNDKIIINNEIECNLLLDCTYNQLGISKKIYSYELTISLIYKRLNNNICFESLTIMDGEFFSLFPRDISKESYTLTHVKYTPLIKSKNIVDILNYKLDKKKIKLVIKNMEKEVKFYYKEFNTDFIYKDYFTSYKCKLIDNNDNRECNIDEINNIISVNCGKITGIFKFEDYLKKYLQDKL
jgi:hypothetical protein